MGKELRRIRFVRISVLPRKEDDSLVKHREIQLRQLAIICANGSQPWMKYPTKIQYMWNVRMNST